MMVLATTAPAICASCGWAGEPATAVILAGLTVTLCPTCSMELELQLHPRNQDNGPWLTLRGVHFDKSQYH